MASSVPRTGESLNIVWSDVRAEGRLTPITAATPGVSATYTLWRHGAQVGSGTLAWEAHGYKNAWVKRITLPTTPGPLTIKLSIVATLDGESVIGREQGSVQVAA